MPRKDLYRMASIPLRERLDGPERKAMRKGQSPRCTRAALVLDGKSRSFCDCIFGCTGSEILARELVYVTPHSELVELSKVRPVVPKLAPTQPRCHPAPYKQRRT